MLTYWDHMWAYIERTYEPNEHQYAPTDHFISLVCTAVRDSAAGRERMTRDEFKKRLREDRIDETLAATYECYVGVGHAIANLRQQVDAGARKKRQKRKN